MDIRQRYGPESKTTNLEEVQAKYRKTIEDFDKVLEQTRQRKSIFESRIVEEEASRYGDFFKKESQENDRLAKKFGILLLGSSLCDLLGYLFFFNI